MGLFNFKKNVSSNSSEREQKIMNLGLEMLESSKKHQAGLLSSGFWSDKLMQWTMKDPEFKVQLFRFVDCFPTLKTPIEVHDHLTDYLSQPNVTLPPMLGTGLKGGGLFKGAMSGIVTNRIEQMGHNFIAGTDAISALPKLRKKWDSKIGFSVDLLGEACLSDFEAEEYLEKYMDLVKKLPENVNSWPNQKIIDCDHLGGIPRVNVSIKISSLSARLDPIDFKRSAEIALNSIRPLLLTAKELGVLVNFDMESNDLKELTFEIFKNACEEIDFHAGLAVQAYLRSGVKDANELVEWSRSIGRQVTIRLVKGAYWDYETIHAENENWPIPVWSNKSDSDLCFEKMSRIFLEGTPRNSVEGGTKLALGSHNLRSIASALIDCQELDLPENALELQMLYGMADPLKTMAVNRNLRVREYVPVGEMIPGMAYLVRRLLENTSNESWLLGGMSENTDPLQLFKKPIQTSKENDPGLIRINDGSSRHKLSKTIDALKNDIPFISEPLRDFSDRSQRESFSNEIKNTTLPSIINSESSFGEAESAVSRAKSYFPTWQNVEPLERSNILLKAANIMRERRDKLSSILILESGKTWREADADVCEAIDFCEYYAKESYQLFQYDRLGKFIGELNQQFYEPCGVAVIISPWNFPLAICCGMSVAALVTGNTVIVKPAEQTPIIANEFVNIMHEAGAPKNAIQYIPGPGELIGAQLVRDPRVSIIAFTGSRDVGLNIIEAAGQTNKEQDGVKKVICEMGGKNSIIIDTSADLDEAVMGVRASAFNFQGQKCSACSVAIAVGNTYEPFLKRLVHSTNSLVIGDPRDSGTDIGPVIDLEAAKKINDYIDIGKQNYKCELSMDIPEGLSESVGKPFIGPTIFSNLSINEEIATDEIFGPVLSVLHATNFEEAIKWANVSKFKLTGGVYSRKPSNLNLARKNFKVGNLYLNRSITGALVGRQPFGGFGMSGIGSKAGGKDYLLQFVNPRVITENTMRRGFAPGL